MSGSTYQLDGSASELKPHVGHEVEIKGSLESSSSSGTSSTGSTSSTGTATSGSTSSGQRLKVESVRMISSTCSSK
jgi:hypothetical protein